MIQDKITVRMTVWRDQAWAVAGPKPMPEPDKGVPDPMTDFIGNGRWDVSDPLTPVVEGLEIEYPPAFK